MEVTRATMSIHHGVVTLFGFGSSVRVDRGHLVLEDGIGPVRRQARLPRVGHGLKRLVIIGSDGMVSFSALRWLADQQASFIMLDRDGSALLTTGPVCPSDARLRRAQATADRTGVALQIARELITQKLAGQEMVAGEKLKNPDSAGVIRQARESVGCSTRMEEILFLEAKAAAAYWSAWSPVSIQFPKVDIRRIPHHWLTFGTRQSPLTGSPRLAVNPLNAVLNYLYAVLESETRLAAAALGLDPGL